MKKELLQASCKYGEVYVDILLRLPLVRIERGPDRAEVGKRGRGPHGAAMQQKQGAHLREPCQKCTSSMVAEGGGL